MFLILVLSTASIQTFGQSIEILHSFGPFLNGESPHAPPVMGSDGYLYCTTYGGFGNGNDGDYGAVLRIDPLTGSITNVHTFKGIDGHEPTTLTMADDGCLYGTVFPAQGSFEASLYKIDKSGSYSVVNAFKNNDSGGILPLGKLISVPGGFDFVNDSTIYRLTLPNTISKIISVKSLTRIDDLVAIPAGGYYVAGSNDLDQPGIYRVSSLGQETLVYSLSDAISPTGHSLLLATDGTLYGVYSPQPVVIPGPEPAYGSVFKLTPDGTFTTLHNFDFFDGDTPSTIIEGQDGAIYGTTPDGGPSNHGTIFRIDKGGSFSTLYSFTGSDGTKPLCGLTATQDGSLYGTTSIGANDFGTVFKIDKFGLYSTLSRITGNDGADPEGELAQTTDGTLYGSTRRGGDGGWGTLFSIDSSGNYTQMRSFNLTDGYGPIGGPVAGKDGRYYGAAGNAFYAIRTDKTVDLVYETKDGTAIQSSITAASDGNFYGTESCTGGEVFRLTSSGTVSNLLPDQNSLDTADGLTEGNDGKLYGIGYYSNTVVRFDPVSLSLSTVVNLGGGDVQDIRARLTKAGDGDFYGVSVSGGSQNLGTVFRVSPDGNYQVIHSFVDRDGTGLPMGSLLAAKDGNLYGTTFGWSDAGAIYRISPTGEFAILESFNSTSAGRPIGGLIEGVDGKLYGTTSEGGSGFGTVYRFTLPTATSYSAGLHFISVPADYSEVNLDTLFGITGVRVATWNNSTISYDVTPTGAANHLLPGVGYWVRFTKNTSTMLAGAPADPTRDFTIQLKAGWNSIGDPFQYMTPLVSLKFGPNLLSFEQATTGVSPLVSPMLYGYDPDEGGHGAYVTATSLAPNSGYWIYAFHDTTLIIPHP